MAIYSDLNSINPTSTGQPLIVDVPCVYQALNVLFSTVPGQRLYVPEYGFTLEDELFDLIDDLTALQVYNKVVVTVTRWESRVVINTAQTTVTGFPDENRYLMDLWFAIQGVAGPLFQFKGSFTQ